MGGCEPRSELRTWGLGLERGACSADSADSLLRVLPAARPPPPPPQPPGCPLKLGGGFDLGSALLSAVPARCAGKRAEEPTSAPALPSSGPLHPLLGTETVSGCCLGHLSAPPPPCSCSPAVQPHPKDSWERGWGRGAGRSCSAPGWDGGGQRLERAGPTGVAGSGNPPVVASPPVPTHLGHRNRRPFPPPSPPRRWGGVDTVPTPSPSRKGEE